MLFVAGSGRHLPLLAVLAIAVQVPLAFLGQVTLGLDGLALALAATTAVALAGLLVELGVLRPTARGLAVASLMIAAFALAAFLPPSLLLGPLAAAGFGLVLYTTALALLCPPPLRAAWHYLRALT